MKHCARCGNTILGGVVVCRECADALAALKEENQTLQQQNMALNNKLNDCRIMIDKLLERLSAES